MEAQVRIFGLTGGIASGKSSVAAVFREAGVPVVDADEVAREVVDVGSEGLAAVVAEFSDSVLTSTGQLDRKALGAIIFAEPTARARLEGLLHPRIAARSAERFAALMEAGYPLACYDAALLVERGLTERYRPLVVVAAPHAAQLARLMARDKLDLAAAQARLDAQASVEAKIAAADHVLWNDADLDTLKQRARAVLATIRENA